MKHPFKRNKKKDMRTKLTVELHIHRLKQTRVSKTLAVKKVLEETIKYWEDKLKTM